MNQHEFITVGLYDSTLPNHDQLAINMESIVWAQNTNQVCKRKIFFLIYLQSLYMAFGISIPIC